MYRNIFLVSLLYYSLLSCNNNVLSIENDKLDGLEATFELNQIASKSFSLDDDTAPKPQYVQLYRDSLGSESLILLNTYNNSLYFYDYESSTLTEKISFEREGPNGILKPMGFFMKNLDSIYFYDTASTEIKLVTSEGKLLGKTSLRGNADSKQWYLNHPQYLPSPVLPFLLVENKLHLPGQFFRNLSDDLINEVKFTACMDIKTNKVTFKHKYPKELYGYDYNWDGEMFTYAYPALHSSGKEIIYSFPVSHDVYITPLDSNAYRKKYAGSNEVIKIQSLNKNPTKRVPRKELLRQIMEQDIYAAIIYDEYRKVYYRFLLKEIGANKDTEIKDKPVVVIMMDEGFNYLGETIIGIWKECNWYNSFVTKEGLNIEFIKKNDVEEESLNIKIFVPKKMIKL